MSLSHLAKVINSYLPPFLNELVFSLLYDFVTHTCYYYSHPNASQDLKLTPMMLGNLAKELGCKIRKQSTNSSTSKGRSGDVEQSVMYYADLIVPLKFPERRKSKGSR